MTTVFTAQRRRIRGGLTALAVLTFLVLGPTLASAETTWYGPYDDGCYYLWDDVQYVYTARQCRDNIDYVHTWLWDTPSQEWVYAWSTWKSPRGVSYVDFRDGSLNDFLKDAIFWPDGSSLWLLKTGNYGIYAGGGGSPFDMGTLIESGRGTQPGSLKATWRSEQYTRVSAAGPAEWDRVYPSSINTGSGRTTCIETAPSQDYNNDGRITTQELLDYCEKLYP